MDWAARKRKLAGKARQAFTYPDRYLSIHPCSSKTALEHGASLGDRRQPDALDPWRTRTLKARIWALL